jgi:hypothetical protein
MRGCLLGLRGCESAFVALFLPLCGVERCADFAGCRMIIVAAFALNVAHPGPVFAGQGKRTPHMADPEVEAVHAVSEGK